MRDPLHKKNRRACVCARALLCSSGSLESDHRNRVLGSFVHSPAPKPGLLSGSYDQECRVCFKSQAIHKSHLRQAGRWGAKNVSVWCILFGSETK